jgi:hypothetical protein
MANASAEMKAKADIFHALHQAPGAFIIPTPWDRGTALILAHLGFKALATTSMGYAFSIGQRDNSLTREQTLANARHRGGDRPSGERGSGKWFWRQARGRGGNHPALGGDGNLRRLDRRCQRSRRHANL